MAYGTTAGASALVPALNIGAATVPTTAQLTQWLAEGYARINRALSAAGYSTPVDSGADVYNEFVGLNDLYAAAYALRSRGLDTSNGTDEGRDAIWLREFDSRLAELVAADLTLSGVALVASGSKKRLRVRSMQLRRIDGYSGAYEGSVIEYDNPSE